MNLPIILSDLVKAQNKFNTTEYANCFAPEAIVFDEGEKHQGREAIRKWNEQTNAKYKSQLETLSYEIVNQESILTVNVSGTFPGSPIALKYHATLKEGLIETLEIKG
ncbi:hypothetical protein AR687_15320 [Flavobacteriaceae bacterium CRH]|nr:hypothetical protein AR687_15320 [Flavobacteriaceae bacterium CRH]